MKKFLQFIFLVFFLAVFGFVLANREDVRNFIQNDLGINRPCSKPLKYSIGDIDPRFNISQDEVKSEALKAEKIWEDASGRNLFEYDPNAPFKINFIFDERQQMVNEGNELNEELDDLKSQQDLITSEYNKLSASLKKRIDAYKKSVEDYQSDVEDFNESVSYWNSQGGAPKDEYEKLKDEEADLKDAYVKIEKERKAINDLIIKSNNLAVQENKIVDSYNTSVNTYKSKYGGVREFEKGIFNGEAINIYEFYEKNDLELTLMHEFGHYLGLDHTQDPKSIMYPMIGEQDLENPALLKEDINMLKDICQMK